MGDHLVTFTKLRLVYKLKIHSKHRSLRVEASCRAKNNDVGRAAQIILSIAFCVPRNFLRKSKGRANGMLGDMRVI